MQEYDKVYANIQKSKIKGLSSHVVSLTVLKEQLSQIEQSLSNINTYLLNPAFDKYFYIPANSIKQSTLLSIRDKNNTLAQAVHQFYQIKSLPGEQAYMFVEHWMKKFEVGEAFNITLRAGEAYEVDITNNGIITPLADLGMGSIQAMMLVFTFAYLDYKYNRIDQEFLNKSGLSASDVYERSVFLVIIEEPEINLHPALQSKLADFFECLNFQILIETHSEYIIRRTQVLYSEYKSTIYPVQEENLYSVIYFPQHQTPYSMQFNNDGTFIRNFGEGFFDAASTSTLELIRLRRERQN